MFYHGTSIALLIRKNERKQGPTQSIVQFSEVIAMAAHGEHQRSLAGLRHDGFSHYRLVKRPWTFRSIPDWFSGSRRNAAAKNEESEIGYEASWFGVFTDLSG